MRLRRAIASVTLVAFAALSTGGPVAAQAAAQALEIAPPLIEKTATPGSQLQFDIRLHNITKGTLVAHAEVNDFVANGEEGQAKVLVDPSAEPSPYSFKPWVESINDLTLVAGEAKTVHVTFDVPANASPGGHYGVIRFTASSPGAKGTSVSLNASLGSLVLLTVPGKITYNASLVQFYTSDSQGKKKGFFEQGPVSFTERISDKGSVHIQPIGTVRITNMFGKQTAVLSVNDKGGNILPASIRRFDQTLNKKSLFGKYTAELNVQYNGKNISQKLSFWVIPYKLILMILGLIIIGFVLIRMWLKNYARRAVRKAEGSTKKTKKSSKK